MPGHGKMVLVSYHLGQPGKAKTRVANGAILAVTMSGLPSLVLAGFAIISKLWQVGGRIQFELASGADRQSAASSSALAEL